MNDREKLIALIENAKRAMKSENLSCNIARNGFVADFLIANGVTVQRWIPVTERVPEHGEIVLCNTSYFVEPLQWDGREGVWCGQYRGYHKDFVTHWMPLPEPPREGE